MLPARSSQSLIAYMDRGERINSKAVLFMGPGRVGVPASYIVAREDQLKQHPNLFPWMFGRFGMRTWERTVRKGLQRLSTFARFRTRTFARATWIEIVPDSIRIGHQC